MSHHHSSVDAGMWDCAEGGSCLSMLPPSSKREAQQTSWNMMIKTIMILATEDGRNRSAFNLPPQGNETLAVWQHGSVGHRLFVEETIVARAFSFLFVWPGDEDHHKKGVRGVQIKKARSGRRTTWGTDSCDSLWRQYGETTWLTNTTQLAKQKWQPIYLIIALKHPAWLISLFLSLYSFFLVFNKINSAEPFPFLPKLLPFLLFYTFPCFI